MYAETIGGDSESEGAQNAHLEDSGLILGNRFKFPDSWLKTNWGNTRWGLLLDGCIGEGKVVRSSPPRVTAPGCF